MDHTKGYDWLLKGGVVGTCDQSYSGVAYDSLLY